MNKKNFNNAGNHLALVIGVPILIILTSLFLIVVIYCCCQKNEWWSVSTATDFRRTQRTRLQHWRKCSNNY
uniref:Uncharacterized protein n=1 Tax=Wuchereria bancrofti TaxID=6293 RepID=A0A1I8EDI1_WUCBA